MGQHLELLARLLVGTLLAALIGYERHLHGRPAGLRTHLLVGLASTTFMLVSTQFVYFQHYSKDDLVAVDRSRIAASVVTGVGSSVGAPFSGRVQVTLQDRVPPTTGQEILAVLESQESPHRAHAVTRLRARDRR
jgi:MgtC family